MRNLRSGRNTGGSSFLLIFESVMSVFYLALAYIVLFTELFANAIDYKYRLILAIILTLYGIYRIYRAAKKIKIKNAKKNEKDN